MRYLKSFSFLSKADEEDFFLALKRTCYQTAYPFAIFPEKGLKKLEFEPVTILCGGNGSGKTTALNIIAESIGAKRVSPYNKSAFFAEYVAGCKPEFDPRALADCEGGFNKEIITSDDVFDFIFNIRSLNDGIDIRREELFTEWLRERAPDAKQVKLSSMDDYEKLVQQNKRRRMTQSRYVCTSLVGNVRAHSNGESALLYFTDKIGEKSLYLVDEPENSLSAESQQKLAEYIENAARFFNCQFIISSHSPYMLSLKGARLYDLDLSPVSTVRWTDIANVRALYSFFIKHKNEFE